MQTISFSDARNRLKEVLDRVADDADYTVITRRDAAAAVVMSLDSFNSLMETVHLLRSPENAAHLARSISQYRAGDVQERDLPDD
ncbi:MAG: type II toxin-antitoxin system prevent-host-death family antitoxin [Chromatiaceae bacterium]|jgi:antitoxin YefM